MNSSASFQPDKRTTILIAEDEPSILTVLETLLKNQGYHVLTANNGAAARTVLEEHGQNVRTVLLDWIMPEMSGIEVLRWLKAQPQFEHLPVIMVTAMADKKYVQEGISSGAYYYLTKPFDNQILLSLVRAAVTDYQYKRTLVDRVRESENPFKFLVEGMFQFKTIDEGERLVVWIANASPLPAKAAELSEIIINAVEHGNLGIGYGEKTRLLAANAWSEEVNRRLNLPENAAKRVKLQVQRRRDSLTVYVEDQGEGFDYEKYLHFDEGRVFDSHGRGIALASAALDVEFLGKGNRVRVTIPFNSARRDGK